MMNVVLSICILHAFSSSLNVREFSVNVKTVLLNGEKIYVEQNPGI